MTYARITAKGHDGRVRTHTVKLVTDTPTLVLGWVVDQHGAHHDRQWFVDPSCITKRVPMVMDLTYGVLVEEGSNP